MMKGHRWVAGLAFGLTAIAAAGCGSGDDGGGTAAAPAANGEATAAIDVGLPTKVELGGEPLRIAVFAAGTSNSFLLAQNEEAEKEAAKQGVDLDVLDGKFDPAVQYGQMQTALQTKKYNAWIVQANDAVQACDVVSKKAPAAGIVVSVVTLPVCGRATKQGEELWAPGTLNYIGGNETVDSYKVIWEKAVKDNPGPQKVGVMTGPDLNTNTINYITAMKQVLADAPNFEIVGHVRTDYSVPDATEKGQTLVQAHPDMTILMSDYTNITKGGIAGLKAAGLLGKVKVYDAGGTTAAVQYIKDGTTVLTTAKYARIPMAVAVQQLVKAAKGETVDRFIENDGHPLEPGRKPGDPVYLITKDNVDGYTPDND